MRLPHPLLDAKVNLWHTLLPHASLHAGAHLAVHVLGMLRTHLPGLHGVAFADAGVGLNEIEVLGARRHTLDCLLGLAHAYYSCLFVLLSQLNLLHRERLARVLAQFDELALPIVWPANRQHEF